MLSLFSTGFFEFVALPLFKAWSKLFGSPSSILRVKNIVNNKAYWDSQTPKNHSSDSEEDWLSVCLQTSLILSLSFISSMYIIQWFLCHPCLCDQQYTTNYYCQICSSALILFFLCSQIPWFFLSHKSFVVVFCILYYRWTLMYAPSALFKMISRYYVNVVIVLRVGTCVCIDVQDSTTMPT